VDAAKAEWHALLDKASRVEIPDAGVRNGFYACLSDLFIMREPVEGGLIAGAPGTEVYRAGSSGETAIVAIALDQLGMHKEAFDQYRVSIEQQGENGDWADPKGWAHLMWAITGFKAWTVREHYGLTGDKAYLEWVYPRLVASARWQEKERARTRVMVDGARPLTYGLMPRGMGDCGLKDGDDLYGVFLPHNMWAVFADRVAMEAAEVLGRTEDVAELRGIYETGRADLLDALERGAIAGDGYRWIPGVPGKTCGSRWGALNALFPCETLKPDHPLIEGTMRHLRSNMSPGGLPLNTGWMPAGLWVAIALDNLAECHLVRGEGDEAAGLLYATLNHGTPLYTWCEERGAEPGVKEISGDRQHLWTPVAVVRAVRDCLVMERGDELHLALGTHRDWLASGATVGISNAATHFGTVSYDLRYDASTHKVLGKVNFQPAEAGRKPPSSVVMHVRLPGGMHAVSVNSESNAALIPDGSGIVWRSGLAGEHALQVEVQ
jgi:hypothetical protein